ncbi:retrovirus-related pol polyprotein from transposon TNT 1-94 [Tanacetum coccineum]|uniref:Retrovirus-related pol polyprotein from transposon TNT 1-94 n=1 Tax=Tanacetum coccineum TaxID=301880 RepID=A0ABQ5HK02_9ASTR
MLQPLSHTLKNIRDAHEDYLKKTIEYNDTIRRLVERARKQNPSEPLLDSACKFTKHVQELLVYVSHTCPCFTKPSEKLVAVTPMNKVKKVRIEVFTPKKIVHLKETTPNSGDTQKPEIKVYSRRPKQVKLVSSSKKAKIVESKIANNSKPTHLRGSNATGVPSSSSLVNDRKKYISVIVDDYSRFTWVKFLRSKDEAPDAIIECIKNIQVCLNATAHNVRTDNETEFVNETLRDFLKMSAFCIKLLLLALLNRMTLSKEETELLWKLLAQC